MSTFLIFTMYEQIEVHIKTYVKYQANCTFIQMQLASCFFCTIKLLSLHTPKTLPPAKIPHDSITALYGSACIAVANTLIEKLPSSSI